MFEKGQYIIYERSGVCVVSDILPADSVPSTRKSGFYYQLTPVFDSGTIYIPVDTTVFMRPILTREQAMELIQKIPSLSSNVCDSIDPRALVQQYRAILRSNDCDQLVALIKAIYEKQHAPGLKKGHATQTDLTFFRRAQSLLHEELAAALGIPVSEVPNFIAEQMNRRNSTTPKENI
jgi:CarD family transcriptional regulator